MSLIVWDEAGQKFYETGVKNGVLYVQDSNGEYPLGVAWNGLVAVTESPTGGEPTPQYADDIKYLNLVSNEEFGATIEAFTYPDEFAECDGTKELATGVLAGQQTRKLFGMVYKTVVGNDVSQNDYGYKLHLIYGALAAPSEKAFATINDTPEAITFSWDVTTTPVAIGAGFKPTASIVIDSTKVNAGLLAALELILFGAVGVDPRLPLPAEIQTLFSSGVPSALSLSSIVPNDEAANVLINANIVLTFNNAIHSEAIVVTKDDGTIVANTKSWDATAKILTINPSSDFANSANYIVTIGGVVDIYNQTLAASVKNFSTVAP